jgi:hypothetical protein
MTDNPTPIDQARAAARAVRALREMKRGELTGTTGEAYALIDELMLMVSDLWAVSSGLGGHVGEWADVAAAMHRRPGDLAARLRTVADQLQLDVVFDASRLCRRMEDTLPLLDRARYRADRGIPADWTPSR